MGIKSFDFDFTYIISVHIDKDKLSVLSISTQQDNLESRI